jgi:hypothetical protein
MNDDRRQTYLDLLQLSHKAWDANDDDKVHEVRQNVLDQLKKRYNIKEDEISHLR